MNQEETAFPSQKIIGQHLEVHNDQNILTNDYEPTPGMSLRDYFAASAMASVLQANDPASIVDPKRPLESIAVLAYAIADAMLKVRSK
jgi:hypothetical protein